MTNTHNPLREIALALLLLLSGIASATPITETRLHNGLKVILVPLAKPNVVVGMIWYNVGSSDEYQGITGISHALEHMMFKGTAHTKANEYSKRIEAVGGQENAFTGRDHTAYYATFNRSQLSLFLKLEADRMRGLSLNPSDFQKEIEVVKEERRMRTDDNPQALLFERFMAVAHLAGPYHHPTVGWMNDLNHLSVADLRDWYNAWYQPNNATLVLAGDVDPAQALPLVKGYFSAIPQTTLPTRKPKTDLAHLGPSAITVYPQNTTQVSNMVVVGYPVPSLNTTNETTLPYALEVITALLTDGENAMLKRDIVRQQHAAIDAGAAYDVYAKYNDLLTVYAIGDRPQALATLAQRLQAVVGKLRSQTVSPTALQRVKTRLIAQRTFARDSVFAQANELGTLSTLGKGWRDATAYSARIEAVTPEAVQRVAAQYLDPAKATIGTLGHLPNGKPSDHPNTAKDHP